MEKKKSKVDRLTKAAMAMLGFSGTAVLSSCENNMVAMYGTPTVEYTVKGTVRNMDGKPVSGIRAVIVNEDAYEAPRDTVYTDKDGKYESRLYESFGFGADDLDKASVIFEDADGDENGRYETKEVGFGSFEFRQVEEESGFFNGRFEVTGNVTLEEKKDEGTEEQGK